jgi:hypothetical protein
MCWGSGDLWAFDAVEVPGMSGALVDSATIGAERSLLVGEFSAMAAPLGAAEGNVLARRRHWPALILGR